MSETIHERITRLVEEFGNGKNTEFASLIGSNEANVRGYRAMTMPKYDFLEKIARTLDINLKWLLTGEGEMIRDNINQNIRVTPLSHSKTPETLEDRRVPLYEIRAVAGVIPVFSDLAKTGTDEYISIPDCPKCDGAIRVVGDSMYPLLKAGDIIMYKEIHDIPNEVFYGEIYLLALNVSDEEFLTVKYVQRSDEDGHVRLVSQNQNHQDKDIPITSIRHIAIVKASIRFNSMS